MAPYQPHQNEVDNSCASSETTSRSPSPCEENSHDSLHSDSDYCTCCEEADSESDSEASTACVSPQAGYEHGYREPCVGTQGQRFKYYWVGFAEEVGETTPSASSTSTQQETPQSQLSVVPQTDISNSQNSMKPTHTHLEQRFEDAEENVYALRGQLREMATAFKVLQDSAERGKVRMIELNRENKKLERKCDSLEDMVQRLSQRLDAMQDEREGLIERLEHSERQIHKLQGEVS